MLWKRAVRPATFVFGTAAGRGIAGELATQCSDTAGLMVCRPECPRLACAFIPSPPAPVRTRRLRAVSKTRPPNAFTAPRKTHDETGRASITRRRPPSARQQTRSDDRITPDRHLTAPAVCVLTVSRNPEPILAAFRISAKGKPIERDVLCRRIERSASVCVCHEPASQRPISSVTRHRSC